MWKMLLRLVNAAEMRRILGWFVASAVLQGATLALMVPFLRAFYARSADLGAWLAAVVVLGVLTVVVDTVAMLRSYRVSVFEVCDAMIDRVAEHVLALPLGWFNAQREAAVVNATSKEVNTLSHLTSMVIPGLCNAFIVPLVMIAATAVVEWPLALIMAVTAVVLYLVWRRMSAATARANELEDGASALAAGRLVEFARLQPVLRATGATRTGWEPARAALEAESEATLAGLRIKGRPGQAFNIIANAAFAAVMAAGLSLVGGHRLDVVGYLAVMVVASRMLMPLTKAAMMSSEADNARVALTAMNAILDAEPLPEPAPGERARAEGTAIALDGVSFSYEQGRPVLDRVSLSAPQGRVTALVGPSGAGKSTILRLAARFWDAGDGTVTIGGADVRALPAAQIMAMTSMVFQDVYLFDTTIRENLRIARPGATDAELETAARRARARPRRGDRLHRAGIGAGMLRRVVSPGDHCPPRLRQPPTGRGIGHMHPGGEASRQVGQHVIECGGRPPKILVPWGPVAHHGVQGVDQAVQHHPRRAAGGPENGRGGGIRGVFRQGFHGGTDDALFV